MSTYHDLRSFCPLHPTVEDFRAIGHLAIRSGLTKSQRAMLVADLIQRSEQARGIVRRKRKAVR